MTREEVCTVPTQLVLQVAYILDRNGYDSLSFRLRKCATTKVGIGSEWVEEKKPKANLTGPDVVADIPPWIDLDQLCTKLDIRKLMQERQVTKEQIKRALRTVPSSEVVSRKPILLTKRGFNLVKDRVWNL